MRKCSTCSAPLTANSQICRYCGVRNDIDLQGKHDYHLVGNQSERWCPECRIPLQSISLPLSRPLIIERCERCFGLFFDPGEIETLLEEASSTVTRIDTSLLDTINQERYRADTDFKYLKCPVCDVMMNRIAFGHKSGVVVDRCKSHGIWLDGGEISHLLEWKHAGGQLWDAQKRIEAQMPRKTGDAKADIERLLAQNAKDNGDWKRLGDIAEVIFGLFQ